jgi:hypothetical protein
MVQGEAAVSMIYLHTDKLSRPDRWYERFAAILARKEIDFRKVNLLKRNPLGLPVREGDGLIGRYLHNAADLARMKPIYPELAARFRGRVFPRAHTYHYFDDKRLEAELLQAANYPTPRSAYVRSLAELEQAMSTHEITFPLVTKAIGGAGSAHVALARRPEEVIVPGMIQEFCPDNQGDWRINVIGNRVMGFQRLNRKNDFRASGSGSLLYQPELPWECVELAWRISHEQGFESMAYDFVRNRRGEWVVLEFSYTYVDAAVAACQYYYEMPSGQRRPKPDLWPQDFIVDDFLQQHPDLSLARRGWWSWDSRRAA